MLMLKLNIMKLSAVICCLSLLNSALLAAPQENTDKTTGEPVRRSFLSGEASAKRASEGEPVTLVITATRSPMDITKLPTNVTVISAKEIVEMNASNLGEALEKSVGITDITKRGLLGQQANIRMRSGGNTSNQVLVMIDGIMMNSVSLGSANLSEIPINNIERIEIVRGPASALYGSSALGGVINVITKKVIEDKPFAEISSSWGNYDTQRYNLMSGVKKEKTSCFFSLGKDKASGWRQNSDYENLSFTAKAEHESENMGTISFNIFHYDDEIGMPGKNTTPIESYNGTIERMASKLFARQTTEKEYGQIEYQIYLKKSSLLKTRIYGKNEESIYKSPTDGEDNLTENTTRGLEVQVNTLYDTIVGADIHQDKYKSTDQTTIPGTVDADARITNGAVFLQNTLRLGKLTSILGVRYDHHSLFGGITCPRLSLNYFLKDNLKLSGNVGRAFRAPTFNDLYWPLSTWTATVWGPAGDTKGDETVKPEKSWGYDVGAEHKLGETLLSRITLFYSEMDNLIEWADVDPSPTYDKWRPSNVGKAYSQGAELELTHKLCQNVYQNLTLTYMKSEGKNPGEKYYKRLMYTPRRRLNYKISYGNKSGTKANIGIKYVDEQWELRDNKGVKMPCYITYDARLSQNIANTEIFVSIKNIFDKKYWTREGYPLPGTTYFAGINQKF